jgi:hypothetical protein
MLPRSSTRSNVCGGVDDHACVCISVHAHGGICEHVCVGIGEHSCDDIGQLSSDGITGRSSGGRRTGRASADPVGVISVAKPLLLVIFVPWYVI